VITDDPRHVFSVLSSGNFTLNSEESLLAVCSARTLAFAILPLRARGPARALGDIRPLFQQRAGLKNLAIAPTRLPARETSTLPESIRDIRVIRGFLQTTPETAATELYEQVH
jgi:hypothetical protein